VIATLDKRDAFDLPRVIDSPRMAPLVQFVFSSARERNDALSLPTTWVCDGEQSRERMCGVQTILVQNAHVRDIKLDGRVVGRAFADDDAVYCYLGGLLPQDTSAPRELQARQCFEQMEAALAIAGMRFSHVVRTWFYLDRLLDWYREFNIVRTDFFRERGVLGGVIPASTGIGNPNPWHAAIVAAALAIKPRSSRISIFPVASPLQCPAIDYRSSFSRAVEIDRPDSRKLLISGTASIAADGSSAHVGDAPRQIDLTMKVVHAILRSRRMDWSNSTRMIAYFRDPQDVPAFDAWCRANELRDLPVIMSRAAVCRDELLFEVELDAVSTSQ
jgi:enamine deaminase RidA (YjgF/YER057c/UK114 family)